MSWPSKCHSPTAPSSDLNQYARLSVAIRLSPLHSDVITSQVEEMENEHDSTTIRIQTDSTSQALR
jgi:hypothetical protein